MLTATGSLAQLRPHFEGSSHDLLSVLLNATSPTEANLALQVLAQTMPEKVLVNACNLREVLFALPRSPFVMPTDEQTIQRAAGLTQGIASLYKTLADGSELAITTAGNLVLDVIIRIDGEKYFWNHVPVVDDIVTREALDLAMTSDHLLNALIDLTRCMGADFNPKFYLSLDDWNLDYAHDVFEGLSELF